MPVTRQTSVEFLEGPKRGPRFTAEEKTLLEDFLSRCDLIALGELHFLTGAVRNGLVGATSKVVRDHASGSQLGRCLGHSDRIADAVLNSKTSAPMIQPTAT